MIDVVIDVSHHNGPSLDFATAARAGILGVIHKGTQGAAGVDPMLATNRPKIAAAGLLFGTYHFGDGSDGGAQAQFFLERANPDPGHLIALDFESNPGGSSMTLEEARAFVAAIHDATGRWPVLYSGHDLKDALKGQSDPVLSHCPLWLAQYGTSAVLPPGWNKWSLWQYSDGTVGSPPPVPGIGHCDRTRYFGDLLPDLQEFWATVSR